jgi:hypothetical protein
LRLTVRIANTTDLFLSSSACTELSVLAILRSLLR